MTKHKHHHTVHHNKKNNQEVQKPVEEVAEVDSTPETMLELSINVSKPDAIEQTVREEEDSSPMMSVGSVSIPPNKLNENNMIEKVSENVEYFLNVLAVGQKPWYLSTTEVYSVVKNTIASIPKSQEFLDAALQGVAKATEYLYMKTNERTVVFDVEKCQELIELLDQTLIDLSMKADDGLDSLRSQASISLRKLISSLIKHKELIVQITVENAEWVNDTAKVKYAQASLQIKSRFEQMMEMTTALLAYVKEKYPEECKKVETVASSSFKKIGEAQNAVVSYATEKREALKSYGINTVASIKNSTTEKTFSLLKTAQPYVQATVVQSTPIVAKAIEIGQPYAETAFTKAQPYLEIVQAKSTPYLDAAKENTFVAKQVETYTPYMIQGLETAQHVLGEVKAYALPVL